MAATQVIARTNRVGRVESAPLPIPIGRTAVFQVMADIHPADLVDPAKRLAVELWVDRGAGFVFDAGFTFVGGPGLGKNGGPTVQPGMRVNLAEYAGHTVKVAVDTSTGMRVGATVEELAG